MSMGTSSTRNTPRFPLGIASGASFCNRNAERGHLRDNLLEARHTLLTAPRRYGKTSLALRVSGELQRSRAHRVSSVAIDFLLAHDMASVQRALLDGVARAAGAFIPAPRRALQKLRRFFGALQPEITLSESGASVRFTPAAEHPENLAGALEGLDTLAGEEGVRVLVFLDEFQQIGGLREGRILEASIRHAAERARHTSYVFSGSNRHLLAAMFEDGSRPLYHLCDRLALGRIPAADYRPFLRRMGREQWGRAPDDEALGRILALAGCHPYYVNLLCARLWRQADPPTSSAVEDTWAQHVEEAARWLVKDVTALSANQRAVLAAVALEPTERPQSKAFLARTRLAAASNAQAVQVLMEKDLLHREDGVVRVLDPVLESYLRSLQTG